MTDSTEPIAEEGVVEVVVERPHPGRENEYRAWTERMLAAQRAFPGFRDQFRQPPATPGGTWLSVLRFDDAAALESWLASPARAALLKEAAPLVAESDVRRSDALHGGWAPRDATGAAPPTWKISALVLLGLYPIVSLEIAFLLPRLATLPASVAGFVGNALSVYAIPYLVMPWLTRAMGWWLFPARRSADATGVLLLAALFALEIALVGRFL